MTFNEFTKYAEAYWDLIPAAGPHSDYRLSKATTPFAMLVALKSKGDSTLTNSLCLWHLEIWTRLRELEDMEATRHESL